MAHLLLSLEKILFIYSYRNARLEYDIFRCLSCFYLLSFVLTNFSWVFIFFKMKSESCSSEKKKEKLYGYYYLSLFLWSLTLKMADKLCFLRQCHLKITSIRRISRNFGLFFSLAQFKYRNF